MASTSKFDTSGLLQGMFAQSSRDYCTLIRTQRLPRGVKPLICYPCCHNQLFRETISCCLTKLALCKFRTAHAITLQAPAHLLRHNQDCFQRRCEDIFRKATSYEVHTSNFMDMDSRFNLILTVFSSITLLKAAVTVRKDFYLAV